MSPRSYSDSGGAITVRMRPWFEHSYDQARRDLFAAVDPARAAAEETAG